MRQALSIAFKDIRLLLRDRMGFFFTFFFPLIIAVFFGTVFRQSAGPSGIPVAIVDSDNTPESRAFIRALGEGGDLVLQPVTSSTDAESAVRAGRVRAMIVLDQGFGEARRRPFWGEPVRIELGLDPSRAAVGSMINGIIMQRAFEGMSAMFTDPGAMRQQVRGSIAQMREDDQLPAAMRPAFESFFNSFDSMLHAVEENKERADSPPGTAQHDGPGTAAAARAWQPVRVTTREITGRRKDLPSNSFALTFPQGVIWGMMGCALSFAITLVLERSRGTLMRLRVAPLSRAQILGGKAAGCLMVTCAIATVLMLVARWGFGVRPSSYAMLSLAVLCTSLCFVGIMMLLAAVSKTEASGNGLGWGVLLMFSMIGGGMVPLEFMPGFMKTLSVISPIRWSLLALEGGVFRDFGAAEMALPCGILLAIGIGGFMLGTRLFRLEN